MNINDKIAEEIQKEEEDRIRAEFAPKDIQRTQVKAAKYAWMFVAISIDAATAYLVAIITTWFVYGLIWFLAAAGGLIFAEWLWERIGNNDEQARISKASKNVSAGAVLLMAFFSGIAYVIGWTGNQAVEIVTVISTIALFGFHGWQAYQYHEKDDDYIAATEDARADANNKKEVRKIHRAGMRVTAKQMVYKAGEKYEREQGQAFIKAAGRSYSSDTPAPTRDNGTGKSPDPH